jgi:dihydroxy-acid dehydratase
MRPIHLNGIAKHLGIELTNDDWERIGHAIPLWSTCSRPAASSARITTAPAASRPIVAELIAGACCRIRAPYRQRRTMGENCEGRFHGDREVIRAWTSRC